MLRQVRLMFIGWAILSLTLFILLVFDINVWLGAAAALMIALSAMLPRYGARHARHRQH